MHRSCAIVALLDQYKRQAYLQPKMPTQYLTGMYAVLWWYHPLRHILVLAFPVRDASSSDNSLSDILTTSMVKRFVPR